MYNFSNANPVNLKAKEQKEKKNKDKQENTTLKTPKKLDSLQEHSMIHTTFITKCALA